MNKNLLYSISIIFVFVVYLITLAPGIVQIDSGELAAVASTLGIAHPTGYPLFTIVGYLFTKLIFFTSKIFALNLLSAIYTLVGFYFIIKINQIVLNQLKTKTSGGKKSKKKSSTSVEFSKDQILIIAVAGALTIAFSKTFWLQSTSVEVYSLHILLISASIYLFLKAFFNENDSKSNEVKTVTIDWLKFAFVFGLSFTNHMTSILLIPGFAYLYFSKFSFSKSAFKKILIMLIPFLFALSIYIYLPLSAAKNPAINWGNPVTWENFKRHIMGWQYQSWIFSSTESASKQFKYFTQIFPIEFAYIGLILILLGLIELSKSNKKVLTFYLVLFFTCLLYSINYDINDIDSYFLLSFISAGLIATAGYFYIANIFLKEGKNKIYALLIIPLVILAINFEKVNQNDNTQFQEYSVSVLESADKNSIIISYLWDFLISPSYYLQFVENKRKDVSIIDKELVRRSWYFNQLKTNNYLIYERSKELIEGFLPELAKFERNENYNSQILEKYYREIIQSFIIRNINDRSVYLTPEMVSVELKNGWLVLPDSLRVIPDLFLFKVVKDTVYHPLNLEDYSINFKEDKSYYTETLKNLIVTAHINRAFYEIQFGKKEEAKKLIEKVLKINPQIQLPEQLLSILNE
ncbi:MAG: DUF2723 domain-containing protein [Ignavibacteria bacterium]|jgi:hypothetical protein|nr:DUF2723 domain-containing protein [Ignavibacteria bacterium]MDH7527045.1 DUF2723 domain-containing protein [Ignavibacteria bacterium]